VSAAVRVASRLLAERAGLHLSRGLQERLAACVQREAKAREEIPERYVAGLAADPEAFQRLLDCVTIQETSFFRHPDQFAALERNLLPALQPPVTIWSAGCANGQEAYSLAMVLAGSGWLGLKDREAYVTRGVKLIPMFTGLLALAALLALLAVTWWREGR